jgi:cell shape-determining protein MreC
MLKYVTRVSALEIQEKQSAEQERREKRNAEVKQPYKQLKRSRSFCQKQSKFLPKLDKVISVGDA